MFPARDYKIDHCWLTHIYIEVSQCVHIIKKGDSRLNRGTCVLGNMINPNGHVKPGKEGDLKILLSVRLVGKQFRCKSL